MRIRDRETNSSEHGAGYVIQTRPQVDCDAFFLFQAYALALGTLASPLLGIASIHVVSDYVKRDVRPRVAL